MEGEEASDSLSALVAPPQRRPRTRSGSTLFRNNTSLTPGGVLTVDRTEVRVGERVRVNWDIPGGIPHDMDWVGLFEAGEENPENYLDSRLRGSTIARGQITWQLNAERFRERPLTEVYFCFFNHCNVLLARSFVVSVTNPNPLSSPGVRRRSDVMGTTVPIDIKVFDLSCTFLRSKTFGFPDPYLKLHLSPGRGLPRLPHHARQKETTRVVHNSISPSWTEQFFLQALWSDMLEIDVRDHFSASRPSISHFLGRAHIPLRHFMHSNGTSTMSFQLQKRLPSDRVSGSIFVSVYTAEQEPHPPEGNGVANQIANEEGLTLGALNERNVSFSTNDSSDEEDHTPLVSIIGSPDQDNADDIIPLRFDTPSSVAEDSLEADTPTRDETTHTTIETPPTALNSDLTDNVHETTPETPETESATQQLGGESPAITRQLRASGSHTRHVSDVTPALRSLLDREGLLQRHVSEGAEVSRLEEIRQTLCGGPLLQRHTSLYTALKSHDQSHDLATSVKFHSHQHIPSDSLTESLPPNWEIRTNASGLPVYYDHKHKIVRLDRPVVDTVEVSESIEEFLRRSTRNRLYRHPSQPPPHSTRESGEGGKQPALSRSLTVSGCFPSSQPRPLSSSALHHHDVITSDQPLPLGHPEEPILLPPQADEIVEAVKPVLPVEQDFEGSSLRSDSLEANDDSSRAVSSLTPEGDGAAEVKVDNSVATGAEVEGVNDPSESTDGVKAFARISSVDEQLRESPGFKFITRPDLYKFAKESQNEEFFKNFAVLELIQNIRSDHFLYAKYQHSSKLVKVVNSFAMTDCDLPNGWEKRVEPATGKHVFIDHNTKRTAFMDPRLPFPGHQLKPPSEQQLGIVARSRPFISHTHSPPPVPPRPAFTFTDPPPPVPHSVPPASGNGTDENSYSNRVVQFLRQPNIYDLLRSRYEEPLSLNLRTAIEDIRETGAPELERMQQLVDNLYLELTIILSLFEEEIEHFTFPVLRSDTMETISSSSSEDLLPRSYQSLAVTPPSPPPHPQVPTAPQVDTENHTFGGMGMNAVVSFFGLPSVYLQVLEQCNGISAVQRTYIEWFSGQDPLSVEQRLIDDAAFRDFIFELRSRIRRLGEGEREEEEEGEEGEGEEEGDRGLDGPGLDLRALFQGASMSSTSSEGTSFDDSLPSPTELFEGSEVTENVDTGSGAMFSGVPVTVILQFFQRAEEEGRVLGADLLLPLLTEFSEQELCDLMDDDDDIITLVRRHFDEIQASYLSEQGQSHDPATVSHDPPMPPPLPPVGVQSAPPPTPPPPPSLNWRSRGQSATTAETPPTPPPPPSLNWRSHFRSQSATSSGTSSPPPLPNRLLRRGALTPPPAPLPPSDTPTPPPPPSLDWRQRQRGLSLSSDPPPLPPLPNKNNRHKEAVKRRFISKLQTMQSQLDQNGYAASDGRTHTLTVRRDHLLEDAYRFIMGTPSKKLRGKKCSVKWNSEEGLDYGGPQREFFFKLSRQLFNPYYGLFDYSAAGSYTVQISPLSAHIDDALNWFRFVGRLIGYAIIQGHLLDVFFARHVYKALLGILCTLNDLETLDVAFYNSLKYVQDNDPEPLELTFTVTEETFGEASEYELRPGGSHIAVSERNKSEYIDLMVQWRLGKGVRLQLESLVRGLREMVPSAYLQPFDAQELEWVIAGTPEINVDDWKTHTLYWGGYHKDHPIIRWFWEVVEVYTNELKLRLLQFVIGTSSIPFEGFKALRGSNSLQNFTIDTLYGPQASSSLPIAHTCFNRLDLPVYYSKEVLREKLTLAIEECGTFESA